MTDTPETYGIVEHLPCRECGKPAEWLYMPSGMAEEDCYTCEDHVPRGCSCNMEPIDGDYENEDPENWAESTDDLGRKKPCCEWDYLSL